MLLLDIEKQAGRPGFINCEYTWYSQSVDVPSNAELYLLTAHHLKTKKNQLNGKGFTLDENDHLPRY